MNEYRDIDCNGCKYFIKEQLYCSIDGCQIPPHKITICDCDKFEPLNDVVENPSHYQTGKYECFDVMIEALGIDNVKGFCLGNAFKYVYRCMNKNGLEDVKKARWYLNKYIEIKEGVNNE